MGPLSITAEGIAQTIQKIRDLRNAPKELKLLLSESHLVQRSLEGVLDVLGNTVDDANAGARVDVPCARTGKTPLHFAVERGCAAAVAALLAAGADVHAVVAGGRSVLHIAAMAQPEEDAEKVDGLQGDVEARDATGATPLLLAAAQGNARAVGFLLAAGADVETADEWGYTPFLQAVCYNRVDILDALLDRGVEHRGVTATGYGMAHLVAHYASVETMRALARRRLCGTDPEERNGKGLTPRDILAVARPDAEEELRGAFEDFLRSLGPDEGVGGDKEDGEGSVI